MAIKGFKKGGEAFFVDFSCKIFSSPTIERTQVAKAGNIYVTDVQGRRFREDLTDGRYGLLEKGHFDHYLCLTEQDAMDMIEYKELFIWLEYYHPRKNLLTLEDLRTVRMILNPDYRPKTKRSQQKAINIKCDVDEEDALDYLPKEILIPGDIQDPDNISDYLSDLTGFCHKGFQLVEV